MLPPRTQKDIERLPEKQQRQIKEKLKKLKADPYPPDRRPMTDCPGVYRVDSGEYRIGFTEQKSATEHVVTIELVDRRNDKQFYKSIKRRLGL